MKGRGSSRAAKNEEPGKYIIVHNRDRLTEGELTIQGPREGLGVEHLRAQPLTPSLARRRRAAESESRGPAAAAGPGRPRRAYSFRAACVARGAACCEGCEGCCGQAPRLAYWYSGERGARLLPAVACGGALGVAGLGVAGAGAGSLCCGCRNGAAAKLGGGACAAPRSLPSRGRWARPWVALDRALAANDGAAAGARSVRLGGCCCGGAGALPDRG